MKFTAIGIGILAGNVAMAMPAPQAVPYGNSSTTHLPMSCYTEEQPCSSYSSTATFEPTTCTTYSCPAPIPTLPCPSIIAVSTSSIPCADDCCPSTPTTTVTGTCFTCPDPNVCHIATQIVTLTTGCSTTVYPTLTWPGGDVSGGGGGGGIIVPGDGGMTIVPTGVPTDLTMFPGFDPPVYTLPTVGPI